MDLQNSFMKLHRIDHQSRFNIYSNLKTEKFLYATIHSMDWVDNHSYKKFYLDHCSNIQLSKKYNNKNVHEQWLAFILIPRAHRAIFYRRQKSEWKSVCVRWLWCDEKSDLSFRQFLSGIKSVRMIFSRCSLRQKIGPCVLGIILLQ